MTPHNSAKLGDYADLVLMPGDPFRSSYIAQHFLTGVRTVNSVRANYGYTGNYNGKRVSVQASGMGQPSLAIYTTELYRDYDVKTIIRVGTCGAVKETHKVGDIVIPYGAFNDFNTYIPAPQHTFDLFAKLSKDLVCGPCLSTDYFYDDEDLVKRDYFGVSVVDMETFMLYHLANKFNKEACTVNLVSDTIYKSDQVPMTPEERTTKTYDMVKYVLDIMTND
jgi:purine-nucleoside phosphorylase